MACVDVVYVGMVCWDGGGGGGQNEDRLGERGGVGGVQ